MKRTALLIALASALNVAAAEPADSLEARPYYLLIDQAEKALADNHSEEAAARLVEAMSVEPENPNNIMLMSNLGVIYWRDGRDSLALDVFDRALERAPSMVTVRLNRARLHLDMGDNVEAYDDFDNVLQLDSLNATALYYRGTMSLYGGRMDLAEADFLRLKQVEPKALDTAVALSMLYSLTGRERQAIPYFEQLVEEDPAPEYFAGLAGCLLQLQELSRASEVINRGMKLYNRDPELFYYRAWLNRDRYRLDDARADAERAIEFGANPRKVAALFQK